MVFKHKLLGIYSKNLLLVTHQLDQWKHENVGEQAMQTRSEFAQSELSKQETILQNAKKISTSLNTENRK